MRESYYQIEKKKIIEVLLFLKKKLPKKSTEFNYQLPHRFLKTTPIAGRNTIEDKLQQIGDLMRKHLLINEHIKVIMLENMDGGKFEIIDDLNCIFISASKTNNFRQKVAILAHEMSHFHLIRKHNIIIEDTKKNELITELNAIYCGFGFILLEGYKLNETTKGNKTYTSQVGYIGLDVIKKTIVETAYLRKQKPQWIIENVNILNKPYFYFKLRKLSKEYNRAKQNMKSS